MEHTILHPNAAPVYQFLTLINSQESAGNNSSAKTILDCGAGGPLPPLVLFQQHGFQTCGIDISREQVEKAMQFCAQKGIELRLKEGDMRCIPFEDQTFDHVYEHYSMCHLNKSDTAKAVQEMQRVLKPRGLCFLGVISTDTWPRSLFGEERAPGEYWGEEGGEKNVLHSMFTDDEMDQIVSGWDVLIKDKHVRYLREAAAETSLQDWMGLHSEAGDGSSDEDWRERYAHRESAFRYCHLYYYLKRLP